MTKQILKTLDDMGVALADSGHQWSPELRANYEHSVKRLAELGDELEMALQIIAAAQNSNRQEEATEWQAAATKWRSRYFALLISDMNPTAKK